MSIDNHRRLFRRSTARQAWWFVVGAGSLVLIVGLSTDAGADRVAKIWPVLPVVLGAPAGIVLGYLGVSAWEAKASTGGSRYEDDYGPYRPGMMDDRPR